MEDKDKKNKDDNHELFEPKFIFKKCHSANVTESFIDIVESLINKKPPHEQKAFKDEFKKIKAEYNKRPYATEAPSPNPMKPLSLSARASSTSLKDQNNPRLR